MSAESLGRISMLNFNNPLTKRFNECSIFLIKGSPPPVPTPVQPPTPTEETQSQSQQSEPEEDYDHLRIDEEDEDTEEMAQRLTYEEEPTNVVANKPFTTIFRKETVNLEDLKIVDSASVSSSVINQQPILIELDDSKDIASQIQNVLKSFSNFNVKADPPSSIQDDIEYQQFVEWKANTRSEEYQEFMVNLQLSHYFLIFW